MVRRLILLATLLLLVGVLVLSAPVTAAGKVSIDKAKAVVVKSDSAKPTIASAIKFQITLWLGWLPVQVVHEPPVTLGPQKGYGHYGNGKWISAPIRDHGGDEK